MFMKGLARVAVPSQGVPPTFSFVAIIANSKDKTQMQFLWGVSLMHNTAGSFTTHLFRRVVRKYLYA